MNQNIKSELHDRITQVITSKIKDLKSEIISLKESRDSDTKSSVGDKYETARAMAHIEIDKHERQLFATQKIKSELDKININKKSETVEFGSVVYTNKGNYFMAVAHGKVQLSDEVFYVLSMASPIGRVLYGKKKGDEVVFGGNQILITQIF